MQIEVNGSRLKRTYILRPKTTLQLDRLISTFSERSRLDVTMGVNYFLPEESEEKLVSPLFVKINIKININGSWKIVEGSWIDETIGVNYFLLEKSGKKLVSPLFVKININGSWNNHRRVLNRRNDRCKLFFTQIRRKKPVSPSFIKFNIQ